MSSNNGKTTSAPLSSDTTTPLLTIGTPLLFANGLPVVSALLRQQLGYFQVEEILGFEPEGEGEHIFIFIEKKALNTQQVAQQIANVAGLPIRQISFSGMKDRNAVTRQWFSAHVPGNKLIDFSVLNSEQLTVLKQKRHLRKLRRGAHSGNRFDITLTEVDGQKDEQLFKNKVRLLTLEGFPNYFGEQRFGRDGMNLQKAQAWFDGKLKPKKHLRGIYLSAVRSFLFNEILSKRILNKTWNTAIPGELLMLNGSKSVFLLGDEEVTERLKIGDIHPTGAMYGKSSKLQPEHDAASLEELVFSAYPKLIEGLKKNGLKSERRALRIIPQNLQSSWNNDQIHLTFTLPSGCFATALVRELVDYRVAEPGTK